MQDIDPYNLRSFQFWKSALSESVRKASDGIEEEHDLKIRDSLILFRRAVANLPEVLYIWQQYLHFACQNGLLSLALFVLDRALSSLPVTLHSKLFYGLLEVLDDCPYVPIEVMKDVVLRLVVVDPESAESAIEAFMTPESLNDALDVILSLGDAELEDESLWEVVSVAAESGDDQVIRRVKECYEERLFSTKYNRCATVCRLADLDVILGNPLGGLSVLTTEFASAGSEEDFVKLFEAFVSLSVELMSSTLLGKEDKVSVGEILTSTIARREYMLCKISYLQRPENLGCAVRLARKCPNVEEAAEFLADRIVAAGPTVPNELWFELAMVYAREPRGSDSASQLAGIDSADEVFRYAAGKQLNNPLKFYLGWANWHLQGHRFERALAALRMGLSNVYSIEHKLPVSDLTQLDLAAFYLETKLGNLGAAKATLKHCVESDYLCSPSVALVMHSFLSSLDSTRTAESGEGLTLLESTIHKLPWPNCEPLWLTLLNEKMQRLQVDDRRTTTHLNKYSDAKAVKDVTLILNSCLSSETLNSVSMLRAACCIGIEILPRQTSRSLVCSILGSCSKTLARIEVSSSKLNLQDADAAVLANTSLEWVEASNAGGENGKAEQESPVPASSGLSDFLSTYQSHLTLQGKLLILEFYYSLSQPVTKASLLSLCSGNMKLLQGRVESFRNSTAVKLDCVVLAACYGEFFYRNSDFNLGRKLMAHAAQFTKMEDSGVSSDFFSYWRELESTFGDSLGLRDVTRVERVVEIQHSDKHFNSEIVSI